MSFTEKTAASGRGYLQCDSCWTPVNDWNATARHECPRGPDGRAWRRVLELAPNGSYEQKLACPDCGAHRQRRELADHPCTLGAPDDLTEDLGGMLEGYRKQVEREFAQAIADMLGLVAEAKEEQMAEAERYGQLSRLSMLRERRDEVRSAIESVKVMGGIDL